MRQKPQDKTNLTAVWHKQPIPHREVYNWHCISNDTKLNMKNISQHITVILSYSMLDVPITPLKYKCDNMHSVPTRSLSKFKIQFYGFTLSHHNSSCCFLFSYLCCIKNTEQLFFCCFITVLIAAFESKSVPVFLFTAWSTTMCYMNKS